eukprot:EG_transcript_3158
MVHGTSISAIADDIVRFPGSVQCTDGAAIRRFWSEVGQHVQNALQAKKGIVIPEFGHFTFRRHVLDLGTLGRRTSYQPLFVLHPFYGQQHGLAARHAECTGANGSAAVTNLTLNVVSVGAACGLSRHGACCLLREVCRRAGQLAAVGNPVALDFGVAVVHFRCQRYWAAWSPAFKQALRRFEAQETTGGAITEGQPGRPAAGGAPPPRPATAEPPPPLRPTDPPGAARPSTPAPTPSSEAGTPVPTKEVASKAVSRIRAVAAVEERRSLAAAAAAAAATDSSAASRAAPGLAVHGGPLRAVQRPSTAPAVGPAATKDPAPALPLPAKLGPSAEPDTAINLEDLPDHLNVAQQAERGPALSYKQQKLARALRRLERKQKSGALETWVGQMEAKQQQQQEEREEELRQGRLTAERVAREKEADRLRKAQTRQQLQKDNRDNAALSQLRDRSPGRHEMGTIFVGYQEPQAVKPDSLYLHQQITAKKEALQTEKKMAADMELQHIEAARKEHDQREQAERQRKAEMKKMLASALEEQIQANVAVKDRAGHYRDAEDPGGNFFFGPKAAGEPEDVGRRDHREREVSRRFFEDSRRIADAARESKRRAQEEERARDLAMAEDDRRRFLEAKAKQREGKRGLQQTVKASWDEQREWKKQAEAAEAARLTDRWFAPRHIWKNDSSDDEAP